MKITSLQYAQTLLEAIQITNPKDHDKILEKFVKTLAQNGDLGKHVEIEKEYRMLEMKEKGISQAEVTTAKNLEINSGLLKELNQIVGNKVEIKNKVDEGIIGGVVVRVDDTLIDASVRGQLGRLNQSLKT